MNITVAVAIAALAAALGLNAASHRYERVLVADGDGEQDLVLVDQWSGRTWRLLFTNAWGELEDAGTGWIPGECERERDNLRATLRLLRGE